MKLDPEIVVISSSEDDRICDQNDISQPGTSEEPQEPVSRSRRGKITIQRCDKCEDAIHDCTCGKSGQAVQPVTHLNNLVVQKTLNDPKVLSRIRQQNLLWEFLVTKMDGQNPEEIQPSNWLAWIMEWSDGKGRCVYLSKEKGISPATAQKMFGSMLKVVRKKTNIDLMEKFPILSTFVRNWQHAICKDKLYKRDQANYFDQNDVENYVDIFDEIINTGTESQKYYALLAKNAVLISVMFAGCRLGALLDIRVGAVKFVSIDREGSIQTVVALFPGGSKTDPKNQRTSPITFGELQNEKLCPVRAFVQWLKLRKIVREGNILTGAPGDRIFPQFKSGKLIQTGLLSRKIKKMEEKFGRNLPKFKAHTGRHTITTLALFSKDEDGQDLISSELLEHQLSWCRNTQVLPNYLGHDAVLAKNGFLDKISRIRNQDKEKQIDTKAVKAFWSNKLKPDLFEKLQY